MAGYDAFCLTFECIAVFLISVRHHGAGWTGVALLAASLGFAVMKTGNAAFSVIFWVLAAGFAVLVSALVRTARLLLRSGSPEVSAPFRG